MIVCASGESGKLESPSTSGIGVAVEDGVELGIARVASSSGEKSSRAGIAGSDCLGCKEDVFSTDVYGCAVSAACRVDCFDESSVGIYLIGIGKIEGGLPGDFSGR